MLAFGKLQAIGRYRKDVPPAALAAAGIVAVMSEDCGPCTQLGIDMAERGGVDPTVLRAIVARDFAAMPDEVALVVRFTEATLRHAPEADELREEVVRRFGKRGLIALAFAMLAGTHVSHREICAGPRPRLHAPDDRRRNPAGVA